MKEISTHVAGNTLDFHREFLAKLKGVTVVESPKKDVVTIVFCPIVSRFETDISSALSSISDECSEVIVVAMHHTFNKHYILPNHGEQSYPRVILLVNCLFFEKKGLLKCPSNKKAVKMVCEKLGLRKKGKTKCTNTTKDQKRSNCWPFK